MWTVILDDGQEFEFETKEKAMDFYWSLPEYSGKVTILKPNGKEY